MACALVVCFSNITYYRYVLYLLPMYATTAYCIVMFFFFIFLHSYRAFSIQTPNFVFHPVSYLVTYIITYILKKNSIRYFFLLIP